MLKKIIAAIALGLISCTASIAIGQNPNYNSITMSYTVPAIKYATNTAVQVSTMGAAGGPTEVSGNPVYSSVLPMPAFYSNLMIQDADAGADIYCGYTSNVSTTTATGIKGAGVQGMRICATSANLSTPPTCPSSQTFALLPYQKFYCVSGETGTTTSTTIIFGWQ